MTIGLLFGAALLFLALAGYGLFLDGRWPRKTRFHVDWAFVRNLAVVGNEPRPLRIQMLTVARGRLPGWAVVAGNVRGSYDIDFPSFQIVYPDKTVILEAPFSQRLFNRFPYGTEYDPEAYETLQKAMLRAECIIPTHEHWDHVGGVAQSQHISTILPKTFLTKNQINGPTIRDAEFPMSAMRAHPALDYDRYYRAAPGIVLIAAPGHSRGHQMIFVRLQNGREYLFIGDIIWVMANLDQKKARPRLANLKRKENRRLIGQQMKWLHDELYANPENKIIIVPTHDPEHHARYVKKGLIGNDFESEPSATD